MSLNRDLENIVKSSISVLSDEAKHSFMKNVAEAPYNELSNSILLAYDLLRKEQEEKEKAFVEEREKLYNQHRSAHSDCYCFSYGIAYSLVGIGACMAFIPFKIPSVVAGAGLCCSLFYHIYRKHSTNSIMKRRVGLNYADQLTMLRRDIKGSYSIFGTRCVSLKFFD